MSLQCSRLLSTVLDSTLLASWLPPEDSELDCRDMHKERLAEEG